LDRTQTSFGAKRTSFEAESLSKYSAFVPQSASHASGNRSASFLPPNRFLDRKRLARSAYPLQKAGNNIEKSSIDGREALDGGLNVKEKNSYGSRTSRAALSVKPLRRSLTTDTAFVSRPRDVPAENPALVRNHVALSSSYRSPSLERGIRDRSRSREHYRGSTPLDDL